jgi:hypothetical protein
MTSFQQAYLEEIFHRLEGSGRDTILNRAEALTHKWDAIVGTDLYYGRRWRELLHGPIVEMRAIVMADTDEGQRLRHTMPFANILSNSERADLRRRFGMTLAH